MLTSLSARNRNVRFSSEVEVSGSGPTCGSHVPLDILSRGDGLAPDAIGVRPSKPCWRGGLFHECSELRLSQNCVRLSLILGRPMRLFSAWAGESAHLAEGAGSAAQPRIQWRVQSRLQAAANHQRGGHVRWQLPHCGRSLYHALGNGGRSARGTRSSRKPPAPGRAAARPTRTMPRVLPPPIGSF
jgi:hypothetical protein